MTSVVTDFVAHYSEPTGSNWSQTKAHWNQHALDSWLAEAQRRGIAATVQEVCDSHDVIALVEVEGKLYSITHLGRRMELQAKLR